MGETKQSFLIGFLLSNPDEPTDQSPPGKGGKKGLILGLIASLLLGAGGFYATNSGLIGGAKTPQTHAGEKNAHQGSQTAEIAFLPLEPMVISLGHGATNQYLRFSCQLEVSVEYSQEVSHLIPRVQDVLNGYLRAVEARDIENPASMGRLRAQMLRRVQVVTGEGRVRDLLITEFVLN